MTMQFEALPSNSEPAERVELSRSRVRSGRSATRASPAKYPRHDSNVHMLGLGQPPLPIGLQGSVGTFSRSAPY
jgi:hypothetical protein